MLTRNGRILLVEDNADDEALILRAFRRNQIANPIDVVRDGEEALEYLFRRQVHRDGLDDPLLVVLLDIKIPKKCGFEVLETIRNDDLTRHIPVVMLTSSSEASDVAQSYSLGVNSYVRKPHDFELFIQAVGLLGLYWLMVNEPVQAT